MRTRLSASGIGLALAGALLLGLGACRDVPPDPTGLDPSTVPAEARSGTDPMSKVNRLPPELERKVQALRSDLEVRGYQVARGYWTLWGVEDCKYPLRTVGFCYGNNPVAPYVIAVLPRWKDEFVDRSLHHAILAARRNMSPNYRLDEREALVVLAKLPPPGRYFGIQSNVFTRQTTFNPLDSIFPRLHGDPQLQSILFAVSPNPSRMMMVASIGNSINNVVIQQQSRAAFDQVRYFIITPDAGMAEAMTAALRQVGVPSDHVFTEPVSPALVRVGLGPEADDLITYIRYAMPNDSVAGEAWRERLPLTIFRVRATRVSGSTNPFPVPAYEERSWNYDETVMWNDRYALAQAVRAHWNQPHADTIAFFSAFKFLDLVGQHCLGYPPDPRRGPMNCLGDTQDTDYQISQSMWLDDGQVIAVMGTLATETNNATYVSLSVNWFPALVGVKNLSDTDLKGTAAPFADALQHDARLFYVHYLARDCTGLHPCVEIPRKLVPRGEAIKLIQRNYVAPGSRRGPDPWRLLNPIAVVLDGRKRPPSP